MLLEPRLISCPHVWTHEVQGHNHNKVGTLWYQNLCCGRCGDCLCSQKHILQSKVCSI